MKTFLTGKIKNNFITSAHMSEITVFVSLMLLWILLTILSPHFLSFRNILNIGLYSSIMGVSATAMTVCILSGAIDLSVGSVMALAGVVSAVASTMYPGILIPLLLGLLVGLICGLVNGLLITTAKINSFITTISTLLIFRGFAYLYTNGGSVIVSDPSLKQLGRGYAAGIPIPLIIMLLSFVVYGFILNKTEFGRNVYSVGGNETAAYLAGISVNKTRIIVSILSAVMASAAGVLLTAQSGAGLPQAADGLQMDIIAAVILGGASLNGGKGNVVGTFLGIAVLSTLSNGMTLLSIPSFWQLVAKGTVLIVAVILDVARSGGYKIRSGVR